MTMPAKHATSHAPVTETVNSVSTANRKRAVATVALAFASDPMMRWSFPDPERYFEIARDFIDAFGGHAVEHQSADEIADFSAVALWLPPGISPNGEAMGAIIEANMPVDLLQDGGGLIEQMNKFHPHEPHWYLPLIGADPTKQGRGYGSALLKHALARCDRDKLPAYLESSNPVNVPLYQRHGFEVIGKIQQGSSPELVPMLRKPR
ncbi:MAG TPA: GNAT family N-acetyltransferase [Xanthobacteraceae bacterium]|nr:GNAT family N-acetyltransferase [Xanthobacteraceae bacterium]